MVNRDNREIGGRPRRDDDFALSSTMKVQNGAVNDAVMYSFGLTYHVSRLSKR
jgi:hypothetical protein